MRQRKNKSSWQPAKADQGGARVRPTGRTGAAGEIRTETGADIRPGPPPRPRRWGSVRRMSRLWKMYREDKARGGPAVLEDTIISLTAVIKGGLSPLRSIPVAWFYEWKEQYYPTKPN